MIFDDLARQRATRAARRILRRDTVTARIVLAYTDCDGTLHNPYLYRTMPRLKAMTRLELEDYIIEREEEFQSEEGHQVW